MGIKFLNFKGWGYSIISRLSGLQGRVYLPLTVTKLCPNLFLALGQYNHIQSLDSIIYRI